jgi:class 3 adenylate cyclase
MIPKKRTNAEELRDLIYGLTGSPPKPPTDNSLAGIINALVPGEPRLGKGADSLLDKVLGLSSTVPTPTLRPLGAVAPPIGSSDLKLGRLSHPSLGHLTAPALIPLIPLTGLRDAVGEAKPLGIRQCQSLIQNVAQRAVTINSGRTLPGIDDLAILEGRTIRAAMLYSDLHGYSRIIATQNKRISLLLLQAFVEFAARITNHYGGSVVDCAGDRTLSVFHVSESDLSPLPVRQAITAALWFQTVLRRVVAPKFKELGLVGDVSAAMGIDYGIVTAGCVGIRNNKHFVFAGDAANNAAKLQEIGTGGEIVISNAAYVFRPPFLNHPSWSPIVDGGRVRLRQTFVDNLIEPPKAT